MIKPCHDIYTYTYPIERITSAKTCRIASRSLESTNRSRSLSSHTDNKTKKSGKRERWPRAMPGTRTFSNLPVEKVSAAKSRGVLINEKPESLAERTRREMKALGMLILP
jgi:hypothetical protein